MKRQLQFFFTALQFYTRIPVPKWTGYSRENLNRATGYFPLVGLFVGLAGGAAYLLGQLVLPTSVAVLLCMLVVLLMTGAFHEDAISDFCDGFGGGYTREQILDIMKDSRIGNYGATALIAVLGVRYILLSNLEPGRFLIFFLAGNALSRLNAVGLIFTSRYIRKDDTSKIKPIGDKQHPVTLILALVFGLLPLLFLPWQATVLVLPALLLTLFLFRRYIHKVVGGYTGDILGALQQISELICYLFFLISARMP